MQITRTRRRKKKKEKKKKTQMMTMMARQSWKRKEKVGRQVCENQNGFTTHMAIPFSRQSHRALGDRADLTTFARKISP